MHVGEAIAKAKSFFQEFLAEERVSKPRLEEVEYDEAGAVWLITLSGTLPLETDRWTGLAVSSAFERTYKTVKIDDQGSRLP